MSWAAEERLNAVRARMLKAEARVTELEKLCNDMEAEVMGYATEAAEAADLLNEWARAYWEITKILDMSELADYDDELASNVRERRALAERLLFPETNDEGISQAAD